MDAEWPGIAEPDFGNPAIRIPAMPKDANPNGDIFGGWLMGLMDMGAGMIAAGHARGRVVTIAMNGMVFHAPVKIGDEVSVYGRVDKIGRTSLTVTVEAWRRPIRTNENVKVTEAVFTFVAMDADGRPRPVER